MPDTNRRCPQCDPYTSWIAGLDFCPNHGLLIAEFPVPECPRCGVELLSRHRKFCGHCGQPLQTEEAACPTTSN